jgi:hypothetical protein
MAVRSGSECGCGQARMALSRGATEHVIDLLVHAGRRGLKTVDGLTHSVRIGIAGRRRYVDTSAVGNF